MNPYLGFGLVTLSFAATVTFARLHIDGGAYAATVLGLGVALLQTTAHQQAVKAATRPPPPATTPPPPPTIPRPPPPPSNVGNA